MREIYLLCRAAVVVSRLNSGMQKFIHTFMQTHKPLSTSQGKKLFTKGTWVSAEQNLNEVRRTDRKAMQTHAHKHFHHTSMDMC